jgi:hypothetical protein
VPRFRAGGDDIDRPVGFQRLPDFFFQINTPFPFECMEKSS